MSDGIPSARAKQEARMKALLARDEAEWAAIEDAIVIVIGLRAGHTLTVADADAIARVEAYRREDEESSVDAYSRGLEDGRAEAGGREVADLLKRIEVLRNRCATEKALKRFYAALVRSPTQDTGEGT